MIWQDPPEHNSGPQIGGRKYGTEFGEDGVCLNPEPFYPDDLPRLERDRFEDGSTWTEAELLEAIDFARRTDWNLRGAT